MNFYDIFMYPLEKLFLISMRRNLIPKAKGNVLELGAGTGVNFKYYKNENIDAITVADMEISKAAKDRAIDGMQFIAADATKLPFDDNSFDTVVETLLLCSIDGEERAVAEIHRVLKPDGVFIHIDHGLPSRKGLKGLFNALAPIWRFFTQSCRINKIYKETIESTGFKTIEEYKNNGGAFCGGVSKKA